MTMVTTDPYRHYDAAYVLGALSPSDRQAFEQHMAECPRCAAAVREVAGMPGLLSTADPADIADEPGAGSVGVPETLLPRLLDEVRRQRRRRIQWLIAAAAAACVIVAGVAVGVTLLAGPGEPVAGPSTPPARTQPADQGSGQAAARKMRPVVPTAMNATVALRDVAWGTKVTLTCQYPGMSTYEQPHTYILTVQTADGRTQRVASWRALPDRTMTVTGASSWPAGAIRTVAVQTVDGQTILRLHT